MRHPTDGTLRRLLDEPAGVADTDRAHVAECPVCLTQLAATRSDAAFAESALSAGAACAGRSVLCPVVIAVLLRRRQPACRLQERLCPGRRSSNADSSSLTCDHPSFGVRADAVPLCSARDLHASFRRGPAGDARRDRQGGRGGADTGRRRSTSRAMSSDAGSAPTSACMIVAQTDSAGPANMASASRSRPTVSERVRRSTRPSV